MFKSEIQVTGLKEAELFFKAAHDRFIDPSAEIKTVTDYIEKTLLPRRFNEQKNPAGGHWKPSKRVLRHGGKTLTDTRALRDSMRALADIKKNGTLSITLYATGKPKKYAAVHNNGLRIKNRAGRLTAMPKRQFAWLAQSEKEKMILDIFIRGLY